jgi:hypothetical protein
MLWTVLADRQPVAVVAAERSEQAWRIVAALDDFGDLPKTRGETELVSCSPEAEAWTLNLARTLGCAATFLACIGEGMFFTCIGGLSYADCASLPVAYAA